MSDGFRRTVGCTGALDRLGECTVALADGRAALTVPPGEVAQFTGPQLTTLIDILREARNRLFTGESS